MPATPAYDQIASLAENYPGLSAAELHGALSGMLCSNHAVECQHWLQNLFADDLDRLSDLDRELLTGLYETTRATLASPDLDFELLLPDDDEPLADRARALGDWCQGFLFGVGLGRGGPDCSDESAEVLRDFADISRIEAEGASNAEEEDFTEVAEYVRMAVQIIRGEFVDHPWHRLH